MAPLPAAQANANVAPIASVEIRVTLGPPGAAGGVEGPEARLNVAVTVVAALTVTVQVPVPEHAPLQLANVEPPAGVAVRVSAVPVVTDCEQVAPQLMPAGVVTVPEPDPFLVTESVQVAGAEVVPEPVTAREMVSLPATKFTLPAKVPLLVGRNRTVTVWLAPAAREKEPPVWML